MTFLYHDNKWLVINKPCGISTHRAYEGDMGLVEWLHLHHNLELHTCSRLDKETSGVLTFGLTGEAAGEAQQIHENNSAQKTYFFIAAKTHKDSWSCNTPIKGKRCTTRFTKIQEGSVFTLYSAIIHRGRTHQIRRHAAASGIPILGDREYNGPPFVRLCLHCAVVEWPGIDHNLLASRPSWFDSCLDGTTTTKAGLALAEKRLPFLSSVTDCCRLIHRGEIAEDVAIDKYGKYLCVSSFTENIRAQEQLDRIRNLIKALCRHYDCKGGIVKTNLRDPHRKKLFADIALWGDPIPETYAVMEHGLLFNIRLNDKQHPGLFLDQRDSRRRISLLCHGKRVVNLFSFTCSFSIYALAAQAEVVFSVDLAAGCLQQGKENAAANHLDRDGNAKFIREDSRKWLARQMRKKQAEGKDFRPFHIIICDPPVFASGGKGKIFHVEKEWAELARNSSAIMTENGTALFANNHRSGSQKAYLDTLAAHFAKVTLLQPPLDFPHISGQPPHVSIFWCEK